MKERSIGVCFVGGGPCWKPGWRNYCVKMRGSCGLACEEGQGSEVVLRDELRLIREVTMLVNVLVESPEKSDEVEDDCMQDSDVLVRFL